jgi:hypothetical protein
MLHAVSIAAVLQLANLSAAPASVVASAQAEVVRVYSAAGVSVEWTAEAPADRRSIRVVLLPLESGGLRQIGDTVMGAAVWTPLGNGVAYVYYRRVEEHAALHNAPPERVLAYAVAHELGHLLGTRGHSPTGVMRACWRQSEFRQAASGALGFSSRDAAILQALDRRPPFDDAWPIHQRPK